MSNNVVTISQSDEIVAHPSRLRITSVSVTPLSCSEVPYGSVLNEITIEWHFFSGEIEVLPEKVKLSFGDNYLIVNGKTMRKYTFHGIIEGGEKIEVTTKQDNIIYGNYFIIKETHSLLCGTSPYRIINENNIGCLEKLTYIDTPEIVNKNFEFGTGSYFYICSKEKKCFSEEVKPEIYLDDILVPSFVYFRNGYYILRTIDIISGDATITVLFKNND